MYTCSVCFIIIGAKKFSAMKPSNMRVFINAAMSADGKISTVQRTQTRISGDEDFRRRDQMRASSDAVMVGIGTILADNPSLTVKSDELKAGRKNRGLDENPARVVIDSRARTPPDADVLTKGGGRRIVFVSKSAASEQVEALREHADVSVAGPERVDLEQVMQTLSKEGLNQIMVEGGATLNWSMISQGLVDEIIVYVSNIILGGERAPTLVDGVGFRVDETPVGLELMDIERVDEGFVVKWSVES